MKKETQDLKKPFFAAFLEDQVSEKDQNKVAGGQASTKYPLDIAESPTKPALDMEHTMKYPSDGDEI